MITVAVIVHTWGAVLLEGETLESEGTRRSAFGAIRCIGAHGSPSIARNCAPIADVPPYVEMNDGHYNLSRNVCGVVGSFTPTQES